MTLKSSTWLLVVVAAMLSVLGFIAVRIADRVENNREAIHILERAVDVHTQQLGVVVDVHAVGSHAVENPTALDTPRQ